MYEYDFIELDGSSWIGSTAGQKMGSLEVAIAWVYRVCPCVRNTTKFILTSTSIFCSSARTMETLISQVIDDAITESKHVKENDI
jgi:hypothetical protein